MIRRTGLMRGVILAGALALAALIFAAGRRLGLSEIVTVGLIIGFVLLVNGFSYVVGQVIRGYRGER